MMHPNSQMVKSKCVCVCMLCTYIETAKRKNDEAMWQTLTTSEYG